MSDHRAVIVSVLLGCICLPGCSADRLSGYLDTIEWQVTNIMAQAASAIGMTPPARSMVADHAVRVRNAPGTSAPVIGALVPGETISVEGEQQGWYRVRYSGGDGWVSARYLSETGAGAGAGDPSTSVTGKAGVTTKTITNAGRAPASPRSNTASAKAPAPVPKESTPTKAADSLPSLEIAGIPLRWGMSKGEAAQFYGGHAERIDASGAVWLRTATGESGENIPLEWFDLRFCKTGLCGVHYVMNAAGDKNVDVGDRAAADLESRYGPPVEDDWNDSKFGRMRVRVWRTPGTRIRLSHQEDQTYAAIDYEPSSERDAVRRIAREDWENSSGLH